MAAALRMHYLFYALLLIALVSPFSCYAFTWGKCSTTCESKFCKEAPFLRYGKYCGIFYTGCPGEDPCDGLDSCCRTHDDCIGHSNYLNVTCNQDLLDCVKDYQDSGEGQFPGNTCDINDVENTINVAIQAGIWIGEGIGDGPAPPPSNDPDQFPSIPAGPAKEHQIHGNPRQN